MSSNPLSPSASMETSTLLSTAEDAKNEVVPLNDSSKSDSLMTLRIKCNSVGIDPPKPIDGEARDWFEICTSTSVDVKTLKEQGLCQ